MLPRAIANWLPDVVVREFCEFGSLVAAAKAGIPHVEVAIAWPPLSPSQRIAAAMAELPDVTSSVSLEQLAGC